MQTLITSKHVFLFVIFPLLNLSKDSQSYIFILYPELLQLRKRTVDSTNVNLSLLSHVNIYITYLSGSNK